MNQIILKDHGILPGSECTLELAELFRKYPTDTEFVFEAGDYFFLPKNSPRYPSLQHRRASHP